MSNSDTSKPNGIPDEVKMTAGAWVALFAQRQMTAQEQRAFAAWLRDANHEKELIQTLEIPYQLQSIPESQREALRARSAPTSSARYIPERHLWARPRLAIAATVLPLLAGGVIWMALSRHPQYSTGVGEKFSAVLPDGTHVELNSRTSLEWIGGRCHRQARLIRGEAWFEVHADPRCPFEVVVGRETVEVLGTRFDIYRQRSSDQVSVLDGRILVHGPPALAGRPSWQLDLVAGQQATWSGDSPPTTQKLEQVSKSTSWREGWLDFDNVPLAKVVEELQRYTSTPIQFDVNDQRLQTIHVTADLPNDPKHIHEFVLRLAERPEILVVDDGRSLTLRSRPQEIVGPRHQ